MATIEPVGNAIDLVFADDVGIVEVGIVDCDAEVQYHVYTSPVAESDGHTVGVLLVEALDVVVVLRNVRTQFSAEGLAPKHPSPIVER